MEITSEQAYSILAIIGDAILTKTGQITIPFLMENPECYSLDISDIETRHDEIYRSFKHITNGYVHKQDVLLRKKFQGDYVIKGNSFLQKADKKHFNGREYLEHFSILSFSLSGLGSLSASYQKNPLAYKENLSKADKEHLAQFLEEVESCVSILGKMTATSLKPLSEPEIKQYLYQFLNGFFEDTALRDIQFSDILRIGDKKGMFFTICDENYLPDKMKTFVPDNTLQTANSKLYASMLEKLGVHLNCSHVINQIWHFAGNAYKEELKQRVLNFGRNREFDKEIKQRYEGLSEYETEILNEDNVLCKTHFNIMILENDESILEKSIEHVKSVFSNAGFKYYIPSFEGLYNIYIGNIIGREVNLNKNYLYLSDLHSSLCFNLNYTTFKNDDEGIFFNDRIFQIPLRKDIWDAKKKRIPARNGIIVSGTGGGKSVTSLNIIQQFIEDSCKVIVVEFGKSFYQLGQLYSERTLHLDYDGTEPLGINPFYLGGVELSSEKLQTLVQLVLKYWRTISIQSDTNQIVSLTKIIRHYYDTVHSEHSFPDFYSFIKQSRNTLFETLNIREEYFDIESFLHVCSDFMPGGIYENVCKPSKLEEKIQKKDFVIFELTKIKKDPFLVSVIMTILFDTIESKILADRSVRGMLIFDEYAESAQIRDTFSGSDIHSTVAFCYQKLRKENGGVYTIIQTPAQLPDNEFTKGIIGNTQLLYVLPTTEVVYDNVIETFHMKNQSHINLMKSIKNDFNGKRPHSELFIRFQDNYATAVRLELSPEKLLAFQTDGDKWNILQGSFLETKSMEKSIEIYLKK